MPAPFVAMSTLTSTHAESSVVDWLLVLNEVLHCLDFVRRVSLPIQVFAHDPQRLTGAVRLRGITWILLVRHIRVIHKRASRFHDVNSAWAFALCQLRSPSSRVQGLAKVYPWRFPLRVVGGIAALKQIPGLQVRPGAMVEATRVGVEDQWCCGFAAHAYLLIYSWPSLRSRI